MLLHDRNLHYMWAQLSLTVSLDRFYSVLLIECPIKVPESLIEKVWTEIAQTVFIVEVNKNVGVNTLLNQERVVLKVM